MAIKLFILFIFSTQPVFQTIASTPRRKPGGGEMVGRHVFKLIQHMPQFITD
jgi:hypothetical protein